MDYISGVRWLGRFLFLLLLVAAIAGAGVLWLFERQRAARLAELDAGSEVIATRGGAVEVADSGGAGPVVVVFHAAPGGYDQAVLLGEFLVAEGFRVLAISRPGYLRTPLASGLLPEQQADLAAALLHALDIPTAGVLGLAEGTPAAVYACLRHPDRFQAVAMLSPLVLRSAALHQNQRDLPAELLLGKITGDISSAWLVLGARLRPVQTLQRLLEWQASLIPYDCWKLAQEILALPGQREWFAGWISSWNPISPRETGTRNDIIQLRGLPELPLDQLAQPALVLRGELDAITPEKNFETLRERLPAGRFEVIEGAGFLLPGPGPQARHAQEILTEFFREEL